MTTYLLADDAATQATMKDFQGGYSGLIFFGCFFLALLLIGIWWLKRNA